MEQTHIPDMASICRDSRRTADERALGGSRVLLASLLLPTVSSVAQYTAETSTPDIANSASDGDCRQHDEVSFLNNLARMS